MTVRDALGELEEAEPVFHLCAEVLTAWNEAGAGLNAHAPLALGALGTLMCEACDRLAAARKILEGETRDMEVMR